MAVPSSVTDVCNQALDRVGEPPIQNIYPPATNTEILVARHYDTVRQGVIRKWVWGFTKTQATIGIATGVPLYRWHSAYTLPNDFIRFIEIGDPLLWYRGTTKYEIVNNKTLYYNSNFPATPPANSINIEYCADIIDVTQWDQTFMDIVRLALAERLAMPITKSKSLVKSIQDELATVIPEDISPTAQEQPLKRTQYSRAIQARRGAGYGGYNTPGYFVDFGP